LIIEYNGIRPKIAADVFIAPNATVIGDVTLEAGASVWFGAVIRGDEGRIVIGPGANIQDNVVIHVNHLHPTIIEANVTVGHSVVLEGCHLKAGSLIGMNATVLDGAVVGERTLVAAGSVVRENQAIPPDVLAAGVPAQIKGPMSEAARQHVLGSSGHYQEAARNYRALKLSQRQANGDEADLSGLMAG
jgi:carbonic anhydrase/acetyltransferase-like protein (isoleucine patch superfamily)